VSEFPAALMGTTEELNAWRALRATRAAYEAFCLDKLMLSMKMEQQLQLMAEQLRIAQAHYDLVSSETEKYFLPPAKQAENPATNPQKFPESQARPDESLAPAPRQEA
jgi:hypothetical protein